MEGGGARAHSPELVLAHVHSHVLAVFHGQSSHGWLFSIVGIPLHLWAVVSIVCICFCLCMFLFVCACLFSFMGSWLRSWVFIPMWWCAVGELVEAHGHSWCRHVVAGGRCHGVLWPHIHGGLLSFVIVGHLAWPLLPK